MARPKRIVRPVVKELSLPETLVAEVELELYSPVEGRVPYGAWSRFFIQLWQDYQQRKEGMKDVTIQN